MGEDKVHAHDWFVGKAKVKAELGPGVYLFDEYELGDEGSINASNMVMLAIHDWWAFFDEIPWQMEFVFGPPSRPTWEKEKKLK